MAQNEPRRKQTPPGPSPNSPSLLFEYQCRSGKFIRLANRIEKIDSVEKIESNIFCPNWNALVRGTKTNHGTNNHLHLLITVPTRFRAISHHE